MSDRPQRVMFFRPSMAEGGADRVTLTALRLLDRRRFAPSLALMRLEGPHLAEVPRDVKVHHVRAPRLALAAPGLSWVLGREQPDVLCSTSSTGNIVAAMAHAAARSRARLILSERTPLARDDGRGAVGQLRRDAFSWAKRKTYHRAELVTAVARGVAEQLVTELGLPEEKVRVLDNPVIDEQLAVGAAQELAEPARGFFAEAPVVLACGRLVSVKDYPTLLSAFALVRARTAARLCILGDGPERTALEARAAELGLGDAVLWAGFDPNPFRYMARAALLLHASRAEGMPGAQIQALACGLPVISTDCPFGPREVIREDQNGYLVPVGDAAALAERALAVLTDATLRQRLGRAAPRSVARFAVGPAMAQLEAALSGEPAPQVDESEGEEDAVLVEDP